MSTQHVVEVALATHHGRALDHFEPLLEWIVAGISLIAVAVLVWGVARGVLSLLRYELGSGRLHSLREAQSDMRQRIGFYLLLGLELLIAADVIETMVKPTLEQLGILAGISAIRIVTGYSLAKELQHEREHLGSPESEAAQEIRTEDG